MSPVPIALFGKQPALAANFIALMKPEYDVVHVCHNVPAAKEELSALLDGNPTAPSSRQGSNIGCSTPQIPKAVFVGGGFSKEEVDEMREVAALKSVPWLYAARRSQGVMPGPPSMEGMDIITKRVKEIFRGKGLVEGSEDSVEAELWEY